MENGFHPCLGVARSLLLRQVPAPGAEALIRPSFMARLKSCPDTKHENGGSLRSGQTGGKISTRARKQHLRGCVRTAGVRIESRRHGRKRTVLKFAESRGIVKGCPGLHPGIFSAVPSGLFLAFTSTQDCPRFPARCSRQICVCGFLHGKPHEVSWRHQTSQEIRSVLGYSQPSLRD